MADRYFQGYVYQMQNSIPRMFGVIKNKEIVSCSNQELIGNQNSFDLMQQKSNENECFVIGGNTYRIFYQNSFIKFAVFVEGTDQLANNYTTILAVCFAGLKAHFEENYNRHLFYKELFMEKILPEDVSVRANMLKLPLIKSRVVFLLRFLRVNAEWNLSGLGKNIKKPEKYDIFPITETDVLLIAEVRSNLSREELEQTAEALQEAARISLGAEAMVGIGSIVTEIRQLSDSYKEALYALELLYLFEGKKKVLNYNHLGVNRLIYQLPLPLCEVYLREVFIKGGFDSLEAVTLETVKCFFGNSLNISETARQLYIHRNTLMYRLEKVKKLTGLDVRIFDHAIVFRLAMMIYRHVKFKE